MKKIIFLFLVVSAIACSSTKFNKKWVTKKSPKQFKARFETTQGNFEITAKREWSPLANHQVRSDVAISFIEKNMKL